MERDDLIVNDSYSVAANHDEEHGKQIRKKILKVTVILTLITAFEVLVGANIPRDSGSVQWSVVKFLFIALTLLKAGYIVLTFMHLGDERKNLKYTILVPYAVFIIYLIFIALTESTYIYDLIYPGG